MSARTRYAIKLMVLGAFSFWLPDAVWHAIRGSRFNGRDAIALTALLPLTLLTAYILVKRQHPSDSSKNLGWALVAGVWLLGGSFMVIGASFAGGGFVGPDGFVGGVRTVLVSILPIFTIIMATYDGSLGALSIVSFVALAIWVWTIAANKKIRRTADDSPTTPAQSHY